MKDAVIVSGARTAMGKGRKGTLRTVRPDDLGACVIREAVTRAAGLNPAEVEDVLLGCHWEPLLRLASCPHFATGGFGWAAAGCGFAFAAFACAAASRLSWRCLFALRMPATSTWSKMTFRPATSLLLP